jgi:hypothetical protein
MASVAAGIHTDQDYPLRSVRTKLLCLALAEQAPADEPSLNTNAHRQALAAAIEAYVEDEITLRLLGY